MLYKLIVVVSIIIVTLVFISSSIYLNSVKQFSCSGPGYVDAIGVCIAYPDKTLTEVAKKPIKCSYLLEKYKSVCSKFVVCDQIWCQRKSYFKTPIDALEILLFNLKDSNN